jgi:diguanylate cyclase (GGDEF)-like protein/PAS domain S-box-containing protein
LRRQALRLETRLSDRITRFYAALSRTNSALVRARDATSLFGEVCQICVDHGHAKMAYIVVAREGRATPVAAAGPAREFLEAIDIPLDATHPAGHGPIARAIREGRPAIVNDLCGDPTTMPWRDRALALGSLATAAFPIRQDGRVVGALSLHVGETGFFDEGLTQLISEMVGDVSYALDNLDAEERRRVAERQTQSGYERFRKIFRATPAATVIWTLAEGRVLDANDAFCTFLGYARDELVGRTHAQLQLWGERADRLSYLDSLRVEQRVRDHETRLRVRSGETRDVLISAELIEFLDQPCVLTIISDITERKRYESRIQHLAAHDGLTNLPNRMLFHDRLTQAITHSKRSRTPVAVLFVDLDRMKTINDGLGHETGDVVLQAVATRLRMLVREGDTVARLGGDEFLIALASLERVADAYVVAQKVVDAFAAPFSITRRELHLSASVGVAIYPHDGEDSGTLVRHADIAMYGAKEAGGNGCRLFTPEMIAGQRRRLDLDHQMRTALPLGQFALVYQPKIKAIDGTISGVEALIRWNHPDLGRIPPATFIPIAEESGLIVPIGEWVLRTACAQNAAWQREGFSPVPIAVNLSARQLQQPDFVPMVERALRDTSLAARWLELEITETTIAHDIENAITLMERLKSRDVHFAIDDFGTGYSSLSYLKRFRIDRLKIDQSFIRHVHADAGDAAIVKAVISLARSLSLDVTAEGVESAAQYALLRAHGCDEIQGYFVSPPVDGAALAELRRRKGLSVRERAPVA